MKNFKIDLLLAFLLIPFLGIAQTSSTPKLTWKSYSGDPKIEYKVRQLLQKMTLEDKIGQMTQYASPGALTTGSTVDPNMESHISKGEVGSILNAVTIPVIRRLQKEAVEKSPLHIPILFGLDVVHGYYTIFPIPLAQAASWDLGLIEKAERIAAIESAASGINWTYAPMVDIARDPRWGRVVEGAGEDPYLGSLIAQARVRGFQGKKIGDLTSILSCVKHFGGYGAAEGGREYNTTDMSNQSLFNVYLKPYKAAVDANVSTLMSAFNDLNGVPCSGNHFLLTDILRNKWNFKGMVVSDYTSIPEMVEHRNVKDEEEAAVVALNAGVDMDMQGSCYLHWLKKAYEEKKITMDRIDVATCRILELKFLLGLFDDPYKFLDEKRQKKSVNQPEYLQTAREIARQSIVLLKNDEKKLFPLSRDKAYTLALIGPYAATASDVNGGWAGVGEKFLSVSPYDGIMKKLAGTPVKVIRALGCSTDGTDTKGFAEALQAAQQADVVLCMMGEGVGMTGEGQSRTSIRITGMQRELIKQLAELKKPMGLVLFNGRPLDLSYEDSCMDAILESWFLGRMTGDAVADVLFGDYNPSGKITMSFPRNIGQIPVYYNHKNTGRPARDENPFGAYRSNYQDHVPNSPLYAFGHGLSYTHFTISGMSLDKTDMSANDSVTVKCNLKNDGEYDGADVVQLYIRDCVSSPTRPVKELKGFRKVFLKKGESQQLTFTLAAKDLSIYDDNYNPIAPSGEFKVWVANSSDDDTNMKSFQVNP
jgi:beta-glucosidase